MPPEENSRHDLFLRAVAPAGGSAAVPRAVMVFAHQDDEVVALGARLGNFGSGHFVHVTDGAPRNEQDSRRHGFSTPAEYHNARESELAAVLRAAGLDNVSRESLRVPDQEASLTLVALTRTIERILRQHRPEVVFTHPYEGGHPDHDACAFAVHHAVELRPMPERPLIVEGTFYHAGPRGHQTGSFLAPPHPVPCAEFRLTREEQRRKQSLLDLFTTQRETLRGFPLDYERFRVAPHYDFRNPPHAPPVLYDNHPWGMTSREFAELAREAETMLSKRVLAACH
ncbi:MAG TPA: PIG-L family deacetylase [Acidobacteriaceae bacterium]|nr:PIG-L family deacetylase [Acidobacteriaceae bacterium]